jgi:phage gpG-like protein
MRYADLNSFIASLELKIRTKVPNIVAETATEYFKDRFRTKEWDGSAWPQTKRIVRKGTLLVRSSKLVNLIRPSVVAFNRVVISAGNDKVPYAKIHNEGGELHPKVTPAMRKWAWANYYAAGGSSLKSATEKGIKKSSFNAGKGSTINFYKSLALTKKTQLDITIPKRQFMGHSQKLNVKILERIKGLLNE